MIETKPRINRGNRGQLFRATWLSSARCSAHVSLHRILGFGRQILGTEPKGHELKSVPSTAGIKLLFSNA